MKEALAKQIELTSRLETLVSEGGTEDRVFQPLNELVHTWKTIQTLCEDKDPVLSSIVPVEMTSYTHPDAYTADVIRAILTESERANSAQHKLAKLGAYFE